MSNHEKPDPHEDVVDAGARVRHLDTGEPAVEDTLTQTAEPPKLDVTDELIRSDTPEADRWLVYNKGLEQQGYSPAAGLTKDNIDQLSPEYQIDTNSAGLETNPIVVPSDPPVMYFTQNNQVIHCVNARTGRQYWRFEYGMPEDPNYEPLPRDRGVAVYGDKVYFGTGVMTLLALNRYTGRKLWEADGLTESQYNQMPYAWVGYGFAQAPIAYDGKVFVGQSGGDESPPGWTYGMAYDADTGERLWETNMIPHNEWVGETWKHGNGSPWMSPSYDTETDTIFWNTGNPGPMLNGLVRPGPNQMTAGIIALDAETGEKKWNNQLVPHDIWDYDGQFCTSILEAEVEGERKRVVEASHKTGWTFLFDIETGQLVERSRPFAKQDGVFLEMLPQGRENRQNLWPGTPGGTEWPPDGYSRKTGLKYIGANDYANAIWYDTGWEYGEDAGVGGGYTALPKGLGEEFEHKAFVRAVDPSTGDIVWETRLPDVNPTWGSWRLFTGGTTATAGGLVFHGSSGGHLYALDDETGEILWRNDTGARILTEPITWTDPGAGKQFVAVAAGEQIEVYTANVSIQGSNQ